MAVVQRILDEKIVAIFRRVTPDQALAVAGALAEAGVGVMELALSEEGALAGLETLCAWARGRDVVVGAGTVVTPELAQAALAAGARFLVTPHLAPEVVRLARERGVPVLVGAFTPTEVYQAMALGADLVKVFPASTGGPAHIKALLGPYPKARLVPTGGVTPANAAQYLAAGAVAVGVGGALVDPHDLEGVRVKALELVQAVRGAR